MVSDLVVLHGFGVSSEWMSRYFDAFSADYHLHILDLPYSPKSKSNLAFSVEDCTRFVTEYLKAQSIEHPIIIGESLGACVAMELATIRDVRALVLITPLIKFRGSVLKNLFSIFVLPLRLTATNLAQKMFPNEDHYRKLFLRILSSNSKLKLLSSFIALIRFNGWRLLTKIKAPTLIVGGSYDKTAQFEDLRRMSKEMNAKLFLNKDSGHQVAVTKWPEITREISNFLHIH